MNGYLISFLGIAKKSGNLFLGMDNIKKNIIKKNILLILTAKDISKLSLKKITCLSRKNNVITIPIDFTMQDIFSILKKHSGVIGVSNKNIVSKILSLCAAETTGLKQ